MLQANIRQAVYGYYTMTDELSVPAGILQYGSEPRNTQKHLHNILQHTFKAVKTLLIQSYKVNEGKVRHYLSVSFFLY